MTVMERVKMLNETMRESPLIYFHDCGTGNNLPKAGTYSSTEVAPKLVAREQHYWNHLNLRGDANAEDFCQVVSGILGISLQDTFLQKWGCQFMNYY